MSGSSLIIYVKKHMLKTWMLKTFSIFKTIHAYIEVYSLETTSTLTCFMHNVKVSKNAKIKYGGCVKVLF
jgi:hypothetical protein